MYELRAHQSAPVYQILPLSADMEHYAQLCHIVTTNCKFVVNNALILIG